MSALLARLRSAGLTVSCNGDQLIVEPSSKLTDELRVAIRNSKQELLDALVETAAAPRGLPDRIRRMAKRWGFSPSELAEELNRAKANPTRALIWVEHDETRFGDGETINARH